MNGKEYIHNLIHRKIIEILDIRKYKSQNV